MAKATMKMAWHETEVFFPALKFGAILKQGGNVRRRYEGCIFAKRNNLEMGVYDVE